MSPPNDTWQKITAQASQVPDILKEAEVIKNVQNILQTNASVCSSLGHPFLTQMSRIYTDMLNFYRRAVLPALVPCLPLLRCRCLGDCKERLACCRMYSELISSAIAAGGPHASRTSQVKLMRSCKKVALKVIETFVDKCEDANLLAQSIVPAMMDPILGDYARNVPDARQVWAAHLHWGGGRVGRDASSQLA